MYAFHARYPRSHGLASAIPDQRRSQVLHPRILMILINFLAVLTSPQPPACYPDTSRFQTAQGRPRQTKDAKKTKRTQSSRNRTLSENGQHSVTKILQARRII